MKQMAGMREGNIAQIKVSLQDVEPVIWRRLEVPAEIKLARLHVALQAAMGWQDYHLHAFRIGDIEYGVPNPEYEPMGVPLKDDRRATLRSLVGVGESFVYEYDFGDGWEHEILVEAALAPRPRTRYPRVVDGARACPPEDVGGTPGYEDSSRQSPICATRSATPCSNGPAARSIQRLSTSTPRTANWTSGSAKSL